MAEIKKVYKNWTAYDVLNSDTVVDAVIPSQSWNSWKFLTTDGSDVSWATVDALPSQTSQSGKFLTTDGTTASWANVDALPTQTGQSWKFLTTNWTTASWDNVEEWITKIFTLSSTSDLTTAQAALDRYNNWWNPIIKLNALLFNLHYISSTWAYFGRVYWTWDWVTTLISVGTIVFTISSWSVTAIENKNNNINKSATAPTVNDGTITLVI